ncbi:hypothetical protein CYMTET_41034 [Cymbomonas tetramitiformis]|uniref:Uncharacterized protein n=1 Tax=Cymbomonas tetramitiformis TaxID=36881 RepID=A0AAE0C8X4_9CHLO|nr:hypothetical protein CYMTET_41034 [Cymbomonas tetramitiformis]
MLPTSTGPGTKQDSCLGLPKESQASTRHERPAIMRTTPTRTGDKARGNKSGTLGGELETETGWRVANCSCAKEDPGKAGAEGTEIPAAPDRGDNKSETPEVVEAEHTKGKSPTTGPSCCDNRAVPSTGRNPSLQALAFQAGQVNTE